jgi:hypothetical protein
MQTRARTVIFYDTDKFDLYRNNFVLRKRIFLARNDSAHQALVFKFRHPDRRTTESVDPSPAAEIPHTVSSRSSFYRRCAITAASGAYSGMAAKSSNRVSWTMFRSPGLRRSSRRCDTVESGPHGCPPEGSEQPDRG